MDYAMRRYSKFIKWHRWIEVGLWTLLASIVLLVTTRSRFALVPLPVICLLALVKSAVSLQQEYEHYRLKKPVSASWIFALAYHLAFVAGMCFFIYVTALLAIASASAP